MITIQDIEAKQYYVTAQGAEALRKRLEELVEGRAKLTQELRTLASQNDVNASTYDQAQTLSHIRVSEFERQINVIERILAKVKIVEKPTSQKIDMGSEVVIEMGGKRQRYTIVSSLETDPLQGKISNESPLGKSLIGKTTGDTFEVHPQGRIQTLATVVSVG